MRVLTLIAALLLVLALAPSANADPPNTGNAWTFGGNAQHGAALIKDFGCGSCHQIPGVPDADGLVGPPLANIGVRVYIAGMLRNTPDNLMFWLRHPQQVVPGNVMPDTGMTASDARDIATYLYTLR